MQSVTTQHAEFRTELVVNLYSGWIVQLVNASFAWRSHTFSFSNNIIVKTNMIKSFPAPTVIRGHVGGTGKDYVAPAHY
jgi:hypothetical protein